MNRFIATGLALFTAVALSGCLVPENFAASVNVKADGSYTYKYQGTAVHVMAAATMQKNGSLSVKDEDSLKAEAIKAAKSTDFKKMTYLGAGRYDLVIDQDVKPGQQVKGLNVISVTMGKDGVYTIAPPGMSAKERAELMKLNIKVNGMVEVILPSNAKVISHNATGTPGLFSKTYTWKIGAISEQPSLRFTL